MIYYTKYYNKFFFQVVKENVAPINSTNTASIIKSVATEKNVPVLKERVCFEKY